MKVHIVSIVSLLLSVFLDILPIEVQARIPGNDFRVTVPYVESGGKLMVKVLVNGVEGHFLIDTGAPCCVTGTFARKAGIEADSARTVDVQDSNGALASTHLVELAELKLTPSVSFTRLEAVLWEPGHLMEQFGVDGIIGYNLFRRGAIQFDATQRTFTFASSVDKLSVDYTTAIPLVNDRFLALLQVNLGGGACDTVMFDSGASAFYEISALSLDRLEKKGKKAVRVLGSGSGILSFGAAGLEDGSLKKRVCLPDFSLGRARFRDVTSVTTDAPNSRMGSALLQHGALTIDYLGRMAYFLPNERRAVNLYEKDWDVVITVMNDSLCAGLVWDYAKLPLKGGERIVAVNGQRFGQVNMQEALTKGLLHMPGDKARITYLDATGKECEVTIRKR